MMSIHWFIVFKCMVHFPGFWTWIPLVERLLRRSWIFVLENLKQYAMVQSTRQPRYNCGRIQSWFCSHVLMESSYEQCSVRLWVVACFCWPPDLWFLPQRALETRWDSEFGRVCSALYHFMFASCMNSCGGFGGSGQPRHFPGKWAPFSQVI